VNQLKTGFDILVVDDDQSLTLVLSEVLKSAGYAVTVAHDGFKAIAACKVRMPDLIVLDINMPLMSGSEVMNRLRTDERTRDVPLIFLGSRDQASQSINIADDELSDYDIVLKPFDPRELLSRVKGQLKQKELRDKLKEKEQLLANVSLSDPLTDLKSPLYVKEFLKTAIRQARRYGIPFTIAVAELDNQEAVLKSLAKANGDKLLAELARLLASQMRSSDVAARSGEAEFTVVLTVTDKEGAIEFAERTRTLIQSTDFTVGSQPLRVTVSIGLCQFMENMDNEGKIVISHAKTALMQGHESGGNVTLMAE
jgi:diguanylate cyclase (GGDEF)-like protein